MGGQSIVAAHVAAFSVDSRLETAGMLQELLVEVIDLALQGKQVHWNLCGTMFRTISSMRFWKGRKNNSGCSRPFARRPTSDEDGSGQRLRAA